jgi:hypothetical protein
VEREDALPADRGDVEVDHVADRLFPPTTCPVRWSPSSSIATSATV